MRGGYKSATAPTLVMSHSRPVGIWMPYDEDDSSVTLTFDSTSNVNTTEWQTINEIRREKM